jgi:signal peptidase I
VLTTLVVVVGVLALAVGPGIPGAPVRVLRIATTSMNPTLYAGDRVVVTSVGDGDRHVGDVVVVHPPAEQLLVKRVVGLAGDVIAIRDGRLFRNGAAVTEPWSDPQLIDSVYFGPVRVPDGTVFVMGDNRRESRDSRAFGPVDDDDVEARVVAVVWPPSREGTLG